MATLFAKGPPSSHSGASSSPGISNSKRDSCNSEAALWRRHIGQPRLRFGSAGFQVVSSGLGQILRHSAARLIHETKVIHAPWIAQFRSLAKPVNGVGVALWSTAALRVHGAQQ